MNSWRKPSKLRIMWSEMKNSKNWESSCLINWSTVRGVSYELRQKIFLRLSNRINFVFFQIFQVSEFAQKLSHFPNAIYNRLKFKWIFHQASQCKSLLSDHELSTVKNLVHDNETRHRETNLQRLDFSARKIKIEKECEIRGIREIIFTFKLRKKIKCLN